MEQEPEELEAFQNAIDTYKKANRRPFPCWSEVLEIAHSLGYRKVEQPSKPPTNPRS